MVSRGWQTRMDMTPAQVPERMSLAAGLRWKEGAGGAATLLMAESEE